MKYLQVGIVKKSKEIEWGIVGGWDHREPEVDFPSAGQMTRRR